jgi:hypothetical protein
VERFSGSSFIFFLQALPTIIIFLEHHFMMAEAAEKGLNPRR